MPKSAKPTWARGLAGRVLSIGLRVDWGLTPTGGYELGLVRDVADLHGAQIAPAVVTADVVAFGVAGRVGIAGRCGSADQCAGRKADAETPAMAEMRVSLGLAADGGESGGGRASPCSSSVCHGKNPGVG